MLPLNPTNECSVWRPLSIVQDCPLAVCDFRTTNPLDLVPVDIVYPHFVDEAYEVLYNSSHRWFYKKGMDCEDTLIFKLYDSSQSEATGEKIYQVNKYNLLIPRSLSTFGVHRSYIPRRVFSAREYRGQGFSDWLRE